MIEETDKKQAAHTEKSRAPYDYAKDAPNESAQAQNGNADNTVQPNVASAAAPDDRKAGRKAEKEMHRAVEATAIKARIEQLEAQMKAGKETLLRTAAEYENFRKRSAREHDAAFSNGVSRAVETLLPVLDTLVLAAGTQTADANFKKGVELTIDQCKKAFETLGVKEIEALNAPFDPELHAAVLQQPAPEGKQSGTVLQVLQTGYTLADKVIRHATVIVAE